MSEVHGTSQSSMKRTPKNVKRVCTGEEIWTGSQCLHIIPSSCFNHIQYFWFYCHQRYLYNMFYYYLVFNRLLTLFIRLNPTRGVDLWSKFDFRMIRLSCSVSACLNALELLVWIVATAHLLLEEGWHRGDCLLLHSTCALKDFSCLLCRSTPW